MSSKLIQDVEELSELGRLYNFYCTYFDSSYGVIRIMAPAEFDVTNMSGVPEEQQCFYFELHYTRSGRRHPKVYIPSDAYFPEVLQEFVKPSNVAFPAALRRVLGFDPYATKIMTLGKGNEDAGAAEITKWIFGKLGVRPHAKITIKDNSKVRKRLRVKSIENLPVITETSKPSDSALTISTEGKSLCDYQLFLAPEALKTIHSHIDWGRRTERNIVEQGGIYLGSPHKDDDGRPFGLVRAAIPAHTTSGSGTYVEFGHEIWSDFLNQINEAKEVGRFEKDWLILGWYHTHPNELSVFMSGTDMGTQKELFFNDWNSALVLNPHRKLLAGFAGRDAQPCQVFKMTAP